MELKPYQQQVINDLLLFLEQVQETKNRHSALSRIVFRHYKTLHWSKTGCVLMKILLTATSFLTNIPKPKTVGYWVAAQDMVTNTALP